jgi:hypothetical protein
VVVPERTEGLAPAMPSSRSIIGKAATAAESTEGSAPISPPADVVQKRGSSKVRRSRRVVEAAPNGNDHAIILVSLGFFVVVVVFAICRVVIASHY